jgi:hypothetical protein
VKITCAHQAAHIRFRQIPGHEHPLARQITDYFGNFGVGMRLAAEDQCDVGAGGERASGRCDEPVDAFGWRQEAEGRNLYAARIFAQKFDDHRIGDRRTLARAKFVGEMMMQAKQMAADAAA